MTERKPPIYIDRHGYITPRLKRELERIRKRKEQKAKDK